MLIQVVLSILMFVNYIIRNMPKYTYKKDDRKDVQNLRTLRKILTLLKRLIYDNEFLYNSTYLLMSLLGYFLFKPFLFGFHLLEIIRRNDTLINVVNAIWFPKKQIIVTLILFLMVEYYFTIIIFIFFQDQALAFNGNRFCTQFTRCFLMVIESTFKQDNGIINQLYLQGYGKGFYLGGRFWLDNIFFIIVIMLILQMLTGIIVDNFSALRERQQVISEDKFNICFICGMHKNKLNELDLPIVDDFRNKA